MRAARRNWARLFLYLLIKEDVRLYVVRLSLVKPDKVPPSPSVFFVPPFFLYLFFLETATLQNLLLTPNKICFFDKLMFLPN